MSEALLSVTKASVAYGNVEAVRSVSLDVRQNEIVTIIGANGAGKTTLLNAIIGLLRLKGGLTFDARDLTGFEIEDRVATGLCLVPEHRELFGTMPVEDNLLLGGFRIKAAQSAEMLEKVFALFPRLKERRRQLAGTLSGGEQQMLAMGRALDGPSAPVDAGRAEPRPRAAHRRRHLPHGGRACGNPACRSCWSSRTPAPHCRSPTAPT